jgi:hypothetical protein
MPEDRRLTPEKQLLHLIEAHKEDSSKKIEAKAIKHFGLSLFSFGGWLGRLSFFKDRLKGFTGQGKFYFLDVGFINSFIIVCIFMLATYFIFSFSSSIKNLNKIPSLEIKQIGKTAAGSAAEMLGLKRAVAYYLDKVAVRDIFKMGPKNPLIAKGGPSEKAMEAAKNLKLVGISWSDNPDAMIEDSKAMRTFFVKRGDVIGDIKIEAIFKDKVVLNFAGEDIDLK